MREGQMLRQFRRKAETSADAGMPGFWMALRIKAEWRNDAEAYAFADENYRRLTDA